MADKIADDLASHAETYRGFVRGVVALVLASLFVLVALCAFAFGHRFSTLLGWVTIVAGLGTILLDLRSGSKSWQLSVGALVVFGLLTAANIA